MNILLLVATERGRVFVEHMFKSLPDARFTVCSFPETLHEPRYLEAIKELTEARGNMFIETAHPDAHDISFDLMFAVSWRYMVPKAFYERATLGAYVFHDSILPRYRGFSPTPWAIINRERWHGVTLLKMAEGVDEGDVVDQAGLQLGDHDYIGDVMPKLTQRYLDLVDRNLGNLVAGTVITTPQSHVGVWSSYGCKRLPGDSRIDWRKAAADIYALIRASSRPYSGAYCYHGSTQLTVWRAEPVDIRYEGIVPGRVVKVIRNQSIDVLCGDGHVLRITEMSKVGVPSVSPDSLVRHLSDTLS